MNEQNQAHGRVLEEMIRHMQAHQETLYKLAEASEARMDRTNDMICKLTETTARTQEMQERIISRCTGYLDALIKNRDELLEQNKTLIRLHEQDLADKRQLHNEIIENRDKIFEMIDKLVHATRHSPAVENVIR